MGVLFLFQWLLDAVWIPATIRVVLLVALTWVAPISPVLFSKVFTDKKKKNNL